MSEGREGRVRFEPGVISWTIALISLVLPWIGVPLALAGLVVGLRGSAYGWWMLGLGFALVILDVVIDVVWARYAALWCDQPDLNLRGRELIGRRVLVVEPIADGRGKVRVGDTVWLAAGDNADTGARVTVTGVDGVVLQVAPTAEADVAPPAANRVTARSDSPR